MNHRRGIWVLVLLLYAHCVYATGHDKETSKDPRATVRKEILQKYPAQLTDPQKKNRHTFSQFGYNLYEFRIPVFPVTKFITPDRFGYQSYGRPHRSTEKNGSVYSCRGGFIDVSHVRTAVDWTVYLTFKIITDTSANLQLPWEAGTLHLHFSNRDELSREDMAAMAQKIAFERLTWHEIASWHYHKHYHKISEQHSTFTPEDSYSNLLGTEIGKRVALRMLDDTSSNYSMVASEEIQNVLADLLPVTTIKESKMAYDIVDLNKQRKLPEEERNHDVWYDSRIVFADQRYIFKRNLDTGPDMAPWLVPGSQQLGCPSHIQPAVVHVPQTAHNGNSLYNYYTFTINPDTNMFYDRKLGRRVHPAFTAFTSAHMGEIIDFIRPQMRNVLGEGFDKRDDTDPTQYYTHVKKVFLK